MAKFKAIRAYHYTGKAKWYKIGSEFESDYNQEIRSAISNGIIEEVKTVEVKSIEQATTEQGSDDKKRRSKGEKEVASTKKTADAEKGVGE